MTGDKSHLTYIDARGEPLEEVCQGELVERRLAAVSTGDLLLIGSEKPLQFNFARMDKILAQPAIATMLSPHGLNTHRDLLWHFALSRDEALVAAGEAVPYTDTNILSEVRLPALTSTPTGDDSPNAFLRAHMHLDLIP